MTEPVSLSFDLGAWIQPLAKRLERVWDRRGAELNEIYNLFGDPRPLAACYIEPKVQHHNPADKDEDERSTPVSSAIGSLAYCAWLSEQTGRVYRLPSEAEWEYAARAGTQTPWSFGDSEADLGDYARFDGNSEERAHPVGGKLPNPWGLFDCHGNVWEWVQDRSHDSYVGAPSDGRAWEDDGSQFRVLRGGSWFDGGRRLRSAFRACQGWPPRL